MPTTKGLLTNFKVRNAIDFVDYARSEAEVIDVTLLPGTMPGFIDRGNIVEGDDSGTIATVLEVIPLQQENRFRIFTDGRGFLRNELVFFEEESSPVATASIDKIFFNQSNLYILTGRSLEWPDEENIPGITNSYEEEIGIWKDINGVKKIQPLDVTLGIRKIDWASNVVYDQYDNTVDLSNSNFYVITDDNNVYKCISNANRSVSTVKPTHTSFEEISFEVDGYKWKYMFSLSDSIIRKFIVPGFVPIEPDPIVIDNAKPGTVDNLKIDFAGSGYEQNANVDDGTEIPVFVEGDGDQNSSASAQIATSEGNIVGAVISSGGSNYPILETNLPVAIRQSTINGTVQTAYGIATTNEDGKIASISIVRKGTNYVNGQASIVLSSCTAFVETDDQGRVINSDVFTGKSGRNFTRAKAIIVSDQAEEEAEVVPLVSPLFGHGSQPEKELFANYAMINLRLSGEDDFLGLDEFRRIGLVENLVEFGQTGELETDGQPVLFRDDIGDAKYRIIIDNDTDAFEVNESIFGETSGTVGLETNILDANTLRVSLDNSIRRDSQFSVGETIRGLSSNATASIESIEFPDIEPYFGDILFINNREVITRDVDLQVETVTLVIEY